MISAIIPRLQERLRSASGRNLVLSMAAAITARLGLLCLAVVFARRFGPEGYGLFTFATGVAMLGAQIAVLGWPLMMNRMIPQLLRDRDWGSLKGLRDSGDAVILLSSLAAAGILAGSALVFPKLGTGFMLGALLILPFSFAILRRQQLAAMRRPALGLLFDQGFGALVTVAVLLTWGAFSPEAAVAVFAASVVLGVIMATIAFRRRFPPEVANGRRRVNLKLWMAIALPMLFGMGAKLLMSRTDILMLAPLADMHEVGLYGAAMRITYLLILPQLVLTSVMTPLISEAFAGQKLQRVTRLVRMGLLFAVLTAFPFSLALFLFPEQFLVLFFGAEFAGAAFVLILLAIAQLATSLTVPFQALLTMGGRERAYGMLHAVALGLHVVLNLALIPPYKAAGAALSTALVSIALLLAQIIMNRHLLSEGSAAKATPSGT